MGGKVRVADALTSISTMHMPDPDLVWIPAQTTTLGADNDYPEEGPTREVSVDGFWIQTHQVTNAEYAEFVDATGYLTVAERPLNPEAHPRAGANFVSSEWHSN